MTFSTGARYGGPQRRVSREFATNRGIALASEPMGLGERAFAKLFITITKKPFYFLLLKNFW